MIPPRAATVWSLIVRWVIVVSICFAAKDSEIRRPMGQHGAGSSQVATSWAGDRCIRLSGGDSVGRLLTWLGHPRGGLSASAVS